MTTVIYSSDVSLEDHANFIVWRNMDGDIQAIFIERYEDTELCLIYQVELFNKPSDSWADLDLIESMNQICDTDYKLDETLLDVRQYQFTESLCYTYDPMNFDTYPHRIHLNSLPTFLDDWNIKN